jgi:hypothetical protein
VRLRRFAQRQFVEGDSVWKEQLLELLAPFEWRRPVVF